MRSATCLLGVSKGARRPLGRGSSTSELLVVFRPFWQQKGLSPEGIPGRSLRDLRRYCIVASFKILCEGDGSLMVHLPPYNPSVSLTADSSLYTREPSRSRAAIENLSVLPTAIHLPLPGEALFRKVLRRSEASPAREAKAYFLRSRSARSGSGVMYAVSYCS
jgi:hypothetical protein